MDPGLHVGARISDSHGGKLGGPVKKPRTAGQVAGSSALFFFGLLASMGVGMVAGSTFEIMNVENMTGIEAQANLAMKADELSQRLEASPVWKNMQKDPALAGGPDSPLLAGEEEIREVRSYVNAEWDDATSSLGGKVAVAMGRGKDRTQDLEAYIALEEKTRVLLDRTGFVDYASAYCSALGGDAIKIEYLTAFPSVAPASITQEELDRFKNLCESVSGEAEIDKAILDAKASATT